MSLYLTYIMAHVQNAIDQNLLDGETTLKNLGEPVVIPDTVPVFPDETMRRLRFYKDMALIIEDFESWMMFLEKIANELGLNPASDFPKIAGVLNRYRLDEGKEPL